MDNSVLNKKIKLIALDLDGTVLTDEKTITPRTAKAIADVARCGIEVVPVTGRPLSGIPEDLLKIPGIRYMITSNGAITARLSGTEKFAFSGAPAACTAVIFNMVSFTLVTGFLTVILQTAFLPLPSIARAVIVAVPALTPFTTPLFVTLATLVLLLVHFKVFLTAFEGMTVAFKVIFCPLVNVTAVLLKATFFTLTAVSGLNETADTVCVNKSIVISVNINTGDHLLKLFMIFLLSLSAKLPSVQI